MVLEPSDGPLDHVALPVAHQIDLGWTAPRGPRPARAACWSDRSGMVWAIRRWRNNRRQVV
jgi:hypothetical protein